MALNETTAYAGRPNNIRYFTLGECSHFGDLNLAKVLSQTIRCDKQQWLPSVLLLLKGSRTFYELPVYSAISDQLFHLPNFPFVDCLWALTILFILPVTPFLLELD